MPHQLHPHLASPLNAACMLLTAAPLQSYAVRTPAGHPVHENFRVHAFKQVGCESHTIVFLRLRRQQRRSSCWAHRLGVGAEPRPLMPLLLLLAMLQVLVAPAGGVVQLEVLGELMRQSHVSYSRCGLGSGGEWGGGGWVWGWGGVGGQQ